MPYHCATILHVVCVLVSMCTEVNTRSHTREWTTAILPQSTHFSRFFKSCLELENYYYMGFHEGLLLYYYCHLATFSFFRHKKAAIKNIPYIIVMFDSDLLSDFSI